MKAHLAGVVITFLAGMTALAGRHDHLAPPTTQPARDLREVLTAIGNAKQLSFQVHGSRSTVPSADYANEFGVFGAHWERWFKVHYQRPGRISVENFAADQQRAIFNEGMFYITTPEPGTRQLAETTPWRTVEQLLDRSPNAEHLFKLPGPAFEWLLIDRPWDDYFAHARSIRVAGRLSMDSEAVDRIAVIDVEGRSMEFWLSIHPPRQLRRIIRDTVKTEVYYPRNGLAPHEAHPQGLPPPQRAEVPVREEWTFTRWNLAADIDPATFARPAGIKVESKEKPDISGLSVGATAPAFSRKDLRGQAVTLDQFHGKTIVMSFWTKDCPPCVRDMMRAREVAAGFAERGVALVTVESDKTRDQLEDFLDGMNLAGTPVLLDPDKAMWNAYQINGLSKLLVIGPDGKIVYNDDSRSGPGLRKARLARLLDELTTKN